MRLTILLFSLLSSPIVADDFSRCPPAVKPIKYFRTFRERCYEFATYRQDYWADANSQCVHKGGRLATVPDLLTQQFFIRVLHNLKYTQTGIWIGLNDRQIENHFEWISGEPVTFTYWASGQPATVLGGVQDCVLMKYSNDFYWFDHPCRLWPEYFSFICEYDMIPAPTARTTSAAMSTRKPGLTKAGQTTTITTTTATTTSKISSQTTMQSTVSSSLTPATDQCPELVCALDCGLVGFRTDPFTGCALCQCANTD